MSDLEALALALIVMDLIGLVAFWWVVAKLALYRARLEYLREYCEDLRQRVDPKPAAPPRPPVWMNFGSPSRWDAP